MSYFIQINKNSFVYMCGCKQKYIKKQKQQNYRFFLCLIVFFYCCINNRKSIFGHNFHNFQPIFIKIGHNANLMHFDQIEQSNCKNVKNSRFFYCYIDSIVLEQKKYITFFKYLWFYYSIWSKCIRLALCPIFVKIGWKLWKLWPKIDFLLFIQQ